MFVEGVFFVSLAPINDPMLVTPTIAQALGIRDRAGQPLSARLAEVLYQRQVLLALANLERAVGADAPVLALRPALPLHKVPAPSRGGVERARGATLCG